jgi:hypothetical protein
MPGTSASSEAPRWRGRPGDGIGHAAIGLRHERHAGDAHQRPLRASAGTPASPVEGADGTSSAASPAALQRPQSAQESRMNLGK